MEPKNPFGINVIALTSGKGGVGKTNASINIAVALQQSGSRVLLLDADLGLANVDVMIGVYAKFNLSHVTSGEKKISEILIHGPAGVDIVPASSWVQKMAQLSQKEIGLLIQAFSELDDNYDYLIIDTAAGISDGVLSFLQAAHHVVVVAVDEPSSVTDAYAMIKVMRQDYAIENIWFLSNMVDNEEHGKKLYKKINRVAEQFLGDGITFLDYVPGDRRIKAANQKQVPVVLSDPSSLSGLAYKRIATHVERWPQASAARGNLEFFVERFVNRAGM
jgi:flagellar biosynthesis protein FlhG